MRTFCRAFLGAIATVAVVGASSAETLTIGVLTETTSLDPHFRNNWANLAVIDHMFGSLVEQGPKAEINADLAVSWKPLDDKVWEIKLRKGVKWHDGSPFTADDVMFTVDRVKQGIPGATVPMDRYFLQGGKAYKKIDDYTIQVSSPKAYPLLVDDLSIAHIISRKNGTGLKPDDYNAGKGLVGTGPYKFVEFRQGDHITFEANPDYWGGKPIWDKVILRPINSDPARVAALLGGSVDVINEVPTTMVATLEADDRVDVFKESSRRTIMMWPDHSRLRSPFVTGKDGKPIVPNPLRDWRVRRAINHAINRQAIVDRIMNGQGTPASQIVFLGGFGYNPAIKVPKYDPELAKSLLKEAGFGDGFKLGIHTAQAKYGNDVKVSQAFAQMLSAVGIDSTVVVVPNASYNSARRKGTGSVPLSSLGSVNADPGSLVTALHTFDPSEGYGMANWGRFSNRNFDNMAETLVNTTDRPTREKIIQEAFALAAEEVAVWPLYWTKVIMAARKGLKVAPRSDQWTLAQSVSKK